MSRFRLAWIQFRAQLGQLAMAVLVIALGVALAAGMLLANAALRESFEDSVDALAGRAELEVAPIAGGTLDESVVEKVREIPGVEVAAPLLLGSALLEGNLRGRVRLVGVDMLDDSTVRLYRSSRTEGMGIDDPLVFLNQPNSVIVPVGFMAERGLEREDAIEVQTPMGRQRLVIRGVLDDAGVGLAFGGELAIMDLLAAQEVMGSPGRVTRIDVAVKEGEDAPNVAAQLRKVLPAHINITSVSERKAELGRAVAGFQALLNGIALMGLLLGALITANRLATVYQERLWEMGVLRGMGWTPGALVRDLLAEAALVSTFAVLIGLPLGVLFARLIVGPVADSMALNLQQAVATPIVSARTLPFALAAGAGLGSGVLSAWLPAWRASRASIATLKARRRRRDPWPQGAWAKATKALLPLLTIILFALQLVTGSAMFGGPAIVLLIVSSALLVQPGLRGVSPVIGKLFGETAWIGVRDQSRAPSRAIGAATTMMAGIGLVVWIGNTGASFERYVAETFMRARRGDLIVDSSAEGMAVGKAQPRLSEDVLAEIGAIPGVEAVGSDVMAVSYEPETGLLAVDPVRLTRKGFGNWRLEPESRPDALELVALGEGFLVDRGALSTRDAQVGDPIRIMTPSGPLELPAVGIASVNFLAAGGNIVLSRELYREYWSDRSIMRAYVLASDPGSVAQIEQEIRTRLGTRFQLRVMNVDELSNWISGSVRKGFAFLDPMMALVILVVLVGTADALAANVIERTHEIGTLRSIGYRPGSIGVMVLGQALAIGIVGAGLAVLLGMGMSFAFVEGVLQMILGWQLKVYPTYGPAAAAAALGVLACVLGGIIPAIRASRLSIVRALRYE